MNYRDDHPFCDIRFMRRQKHGGGSLLVDAVFRNGTFELAGAWHGEWPPCDGLLWISVGFKSQKYRVRLPDGITEANYRAVPMIDVPDKEPPHDP